MTFNVEMYMPALNPLRVFLTLPLLTCLGVLLTACGGSQNPSGGSPKGAAMGGPIEVGYRVVSEQDVAIETELTGRISARQTAEVRPQVDGVVLARTFEEGALVKAGQALYQIDPAPFQAALKSAEAHVASAESAAQVARQRAERFARLVDSGAVSRDANDEAQSNAAQAQSAVGVARAQADAARINLDYTKVRAPIAGRIGRSQVTAGALVTAKQTGAIATIQDFGQVYVDLTQSAAQLLALRRAESAGQLSRAPSTLPVTLLLDDGSVYPHTGKLEFTEVTVDASTGAVTVRALFPNPEGLLLPGTYARARISTATVAHALLVPQTAVARTPSGSATLTLINTSGQIEIRPVVLGAAHDGEWIIASGLHPQERVVVEGLAKLRPGLPVKPVPAGSTPSPAPTQH